MKSLFTKKHITVAVSVFLLLIGFRGLSQPANDYDRDLAKLVNKVKEFPKQEKNYTPLAELYEQANKQDLGNIMNLRATGMPDIWYNIFLLYSRLDNRQRQVMTLPDQVLSAIGFHMVSYDDDMMEARKNAIAYFSAYAKKLLDDDQPDSARKAYDQLVILAGMQAGVSGLDKMLRKSILVGARNIKFELYNNTGKSLNDQVTAELSRLVWDYKMKRYGQKQETSPHNGYDFTFRVVLNTLSVTPDQIKKVDYGEERLVYNASGQVIDTVKCNISEQRQRKSAKISGSIDFIDDRTGQKVNIVPVTVESIFLNKYATLQGNPDAAGDDTRILLKNKEVNYPSNEDIVMDALQKFVRAASQEIFGNSETDKTGKMENSK